MPSAVLAMMIGRKVRLLKDLATTRRMASSRKIPLKYVKTFDMTMLFTLPVPS